MVAGYPSAVIPESAVVVSERPLVTLPGTTEYIDYQPKGKVAYAVESHGKTVVLTTSAENLVEGEPRVTIYTAPGDSSGYLYAPWLPDVTYTEVSVP